MKSGSVNTTHSDLIISTIVFPGDISETSTLLLVESIRAFAGSLSNVDVWCFMPESGEELTSKTRTSFNELNVTLVPFEIESEISSFPFTRHAQAAAIAESRLIGKTKLVGWIAPNTLVLQEPDRFLLNEDISLGYRPVHHKLLGLDYDEPLDAFWSAVYKFCNVPDESVFVMKPQIENRGIRPYFNAGCLVVRPEKMLFQSWRDTFLQVYQDPVFKKFYKRNRHYAIFMHQAILSGVILSRMMNDEIEELPANYNYPLNLYLEDVTQHRPGSLEECVTIRHEGFYQDPNWISKMPASDELKEWIANRLGP